MDRALGRSGASGGLFRIEGDGGSVPAADRDDAAARHLYRDPSRLGRDHAAQAAGERNIGIDLDGAALAGFSCAWPVELVHGCCHRFLEAFDFDGSELVYSDPPYLRHTRKSARRYRHDYEDADHVALLALLGRLPCRVMISGYPSALYDEHLAGWRSLSLQVMNQAGVVTEKLWFNFAPDRLHWARFAGRNFTDRQRIKRRAESWGRRYRAMPPAERLAVLAAMMAVEAG